MTCKECIHYEACEMLFTVMNRQIDQINQIFENVGISGDVDKYNFPYDDSCGKTICRNQEPRDRYIKFPTKEEAEKALAKMKDGDE